MDFSDMFTNNSKDNILRQYRAINYEDFKLNTVSYSISKNSSYTISANNKVVVKNEKKRTGKIWSVSLNNILIIDSDGDLQTLSNKDFNYLEINSRRFLKCQELYKYFYENYKTELSKFIQNWNSKIILQGVEDFMKRNGSIDKVLDISNSKRLLTWEKNNSELRVNVSTSSFSASSSFNNLYSTANENTYDLFNTYAPSMFISRDISHFGTESGLVNSATKTVQSGFVESIDHTVNISLLVDANNSILDVYTKNVFYSPRFGVPFQFIQ